MREHLEEERIGLIFKLGGLRPPSLKMSPIRSSSRCSLMAMTPGWTKSGGNQFDIANDGAGSERLPAMKLDELDAWLQAQSADPAQAAKMEALMQQHPELRSEAIANLQAMERDSVRLLDQPDTAFLHLSPTEAGPWLQTLNEHLQKELEQLPDEPDATLSPAANSQMMETVLLPLLREMARAVFTPARIQQLVGQLREYRNQQFAAGNKTMASCALGAITSLEREDEPDRNYFLIALCLASLKPETGGNPPTEAEPGKFNSTP